MLKRNTDKLARSIGRNPTAGEIYLTHFLGSRNANRFMNEFAEKPALPATHLLPRPARTNRSIFYARGKAKPLSVGDIHAKFEEMIGLRVERYSNASEMTKVAANPE